MRRRIVVVATAIALTVMAAPAPAAAFHGGFLPDCGGGVTSNCLVSMTVQNAAIPGDVGQIKLQWDSDPGNFFVMAWNTGGPLATQHELGPTLTSASKITIVVKPAATFSPTGVMSMANLDSWGWNAATKELTVVGSPASGSWTNATCEATLGGCAVNKADFDFGGIFMFSAFEIDPSQAPPEMAATAAAFKANLFGGHVSTNAQAFTPPNYDPATQRLTFRVASPHCKASSPGAGCTLNTGFFNAFVPNTFVQNIWGLAPASLTGAEAIIEGQGTATASVTPVAATSISPAGIRISYAGFTFSAPNIQIARSTAVAAEPEPARESPATREPALSETGFGPSTTATPIGLPLSGVIRSGLTMTGADARVTFGADTALTTPDGQPFGGILLPPLTVPDPTGGKLVSVTHLRATGAPVGGTEIMLSRPATLTLPVPKGANAADFQPAQAVGGVLKYLPGTYTPDGIVIQVDRIAGSIAPYGLVRAP
jgi:hypothetical protein